MLGKSSEWADQSRIDPKQQVYHRAFPGLGWADHGDLPWPQG
jgi:hypothetical protein